jgi:hypothetical protein
MTPAQIRARIDALETLCDVQQAIDDASDIEWEPGESQLLDFQVSTRDTSEAVTFVHGLPPAVLIAGLKAMERELAQMADVREAA